MSGVRVGMGVMWVSMEADVGLSMRDGRGGLDGCDGYDGYGRGQGGETAGGERHVVGLPQAILKRCKIQRAGDISVAVAVTTLEAGPYYGAKIETKWERRWMRVE
jgi:hypothetical protein